MIDATRRDLSVHIGRWWYLLIFVLWLVISCTFDHKGDKTSGSHSTRDSTHVPELHSLYIVNEDKLRLRKYPDRRSGIQSTLSYNEIVHYLDEQTDFEDQVGKYSAPWLHVQRVKDERKGWVFGHERFVQPFEDITTLREKQKTHGGHITLFNNLNRLQLSEKLGTELHSFKPGWRFSGYCCTDSTDAVVYCRFRAIHPDQKTRKWKILTCIWDPTNTHTLRCDSTLLDAR